VERNHGFIATMVASTGGAGNWVLLTYRLPREPSTPRAAVWRKLRRLGVAQLADGLVALPADARTREQLEWIAEEVIGAGGTAVIWQAQPTTVGEERQIAAAMAQERASEYAELAARAKAALAAPRAEQRRALRSLRGELRQIRRRDYFAAPGRDAAVAAINELAAAVTDDSSQRSR
jgi:hypothetical protein